MPPTAPFADLVTEHLPVVGYEVNAILHRLPAFVTRDDLAAAGNLGLVQAARTYDPEVGVPFDRWAKVRIRGAILDELRSVDWLSRGARRRVKQVSDVTQQLSSALGRPATLDEVATATGMTTEEVADAHTAGDVRIGSLDENPDGMNVLVDDDPVPEEVVLAAEQVVYLRAAVRHLPDRLRMVIEALFFEGRTIADLAAELGVTVSRVSQIKAEAFALMRDGMNASLDPRLVQPVGEGVAERRRQAYYAKVAAHAATSSTVVAATEAAATEAAGTTRRRLPAVA